MNLSKKIAQLIVEKNISIDAVTDALNAYSLLSLMPSILEQVKRMKVRESLQDTLRIESPFLLDQHAIEHIRKIVGDEKAEHEVTINKNLLAGWKARFKEKLYDASAERIIRQLEMR